MNEDLKNELKELAHFGYHLKLKKTSGCSWRMLDALKEGFYPESKITCVVSRNTKQGKRIWELFNQCKAYKTNFKIKYINHEEDDETFDWDGTEEWVHREYAERSELKRKLQLIAKQPGFEKFIEIKEVREWHHHRVDRGADLIDIKKLSDMGFSINMENANKEFKIPE